MIEKPTCIHAEPDERYCHTLDSNLYSMKLYELLTHSLISTISILSGPTYTVRSGFVNVYKYDS